jgi:large subunit ribosomal protein L10
MPREAHPTPIKLDTVKDLSELFSQAKGIYLADFSGLNVEQVNELRRNFHKQQAVYKVVKNTLIRHAAENAGFQNLVPFLEGPTALAISLQDPVLPVRLIADFHKGKEKPIPTIKAGILEGLFVNADQMDQVKNIPSREVLLSQILSVMQAPIANFVGVLNEIVRSFLSVLEAVIEKKRTLESAAAPPAEATATADAEPPTPSE